jgi:hypothetical protein
LIRQEQWARELLGIPEERRLIIMLPVGKPADATARKEKKPLAHIVYSERYGNRLEP